MKRGELVTIAVKGEFGKPRPAVIVQSDEVAGTRKVLVCPLTSTGPFSALRIQIEPDRRNGLKHPSTVMIGNVISVPREKCGPVMGSLTSDQMSDIDSRLAFILGLAR